MNTIFFYSQWVSDISPLGILWSPPFCCLRCLYDRRHPTVVSYSYSTAYTQCLLYLNLPEHSHGGQEIFSFELPALVDPWLQEDGLFVLGPQTDQVPSKAIL